MKLRLLTLFVFALGLSVAGPLKTASYPVVHPVKTAKAVKTGAAATAKGLFQAVKALVW